MEGNLKIGVGKNDHKVFSESDHDLPQYYNTVFLMMIGLKHKYGGK